MIGLGQSFNNFEPKPEQNSACFDIQKQTQNEAYALTFQVSKEHELVFAALSDYSYLFFDVNKMKCLNHVTGAHSKRINDIWFEENHLYTCSNDGTVKVWDIRAGGDPVVQLRGPTPQEIYCVSKAKNILGGGSNSEIHFWDLRKECVLNTFNETHGEEVTSLQFLQDKPNILLSGSLDGLVCLFDLSKDNEEDAADTVLRLEQPINSCRFFNNDFSVAFAQTTVQTIDILSLEHAKMVREVNAIENLDTNEFALLGAYGFNGGTNLYYLRGNLDGFIEEYAINLSEQEPASLVNRIYTSHKGPIVKAERITDQHILSAGEDFKFFVTESTKVEENILDFEQVKKTMFLDDEATTDNSNQAPQSFGSKASRKNKMEYNPY